MQQQQQGQSGCSFDVHSNCMLAYFAAAGPANVRALVDPAALTHGVQQPPVAAAGGDRLLTHG
jgi:hypothetical protein